MPENPEKSLFSIVIQYIKVMNIIYIYNIRNIFTEPMN